MVAVVLKYFLVLYFPCHLSISTLPTYTEILYSDNGQRTHHYLPCLSLHRKVFSPSPTKLLEAETVSTLTLAD